MLNELSPFTRVLIATVVIGVGIIYLPRMFALVVVLIVMGLLSRIEMR